MHAFRISNAIVSLGLLAMLLVPLSAAAVGADVESPSGLVKAVSHQVVDALRRNRETIRNDPPQLVSLMERAIVPHFDIQLMGREVLGKYWRRATADQRTRFLSAFRKMLIDDYAAIFGKYTNQSVELLPTHAPSHRGEALVSTIVVMPGGRRVRVDYRLHQEGVDWRIYDVAVDGVSLLLNYRNTFSEALQRKNLDGLITRIENKNISFHLKSGKSDEASVDSSDVR